MKAAISMFMLLGALELTLTFGDAMSGVQNKAGTSMNYKLVFDLGYHRG